MPSLSCTQPSLTPSPASTPRSSSPLLNNQIPLVNSTPIRNYFARFSNDTNTSDRQRRRTQSIQRSISPRTLWRQSPDKTIPFPPSQSCPLSRTTNNIKLDSSKYDQFYHPLTQTITNRKDLNVFSSAYLDKTKKYFDEQPFLDPTLQTLQINNVHKLLCDQNDLLRQNQQQDSFDDIDDAAMDALQRYGDDAITKILQNAENPILKIDEIELADTPIDRAKQFITLLQSDSNNHPSYSSYDDMKTVVVFLSGILEHIVATMLDASGSLAEFNHSITEKTDEHEQIYKNMLEDNPLMITEYDKDVYARDIDRNSFIIRPLHIRHAIASDPELFWMQQSIQTLHTPNKYRSDIQDDLNTDCVYHICSFFCGDLPMLSSLARVNSTFYAMTSSNLLWRPIARRCFLFNFELIQSIEDSDDICDDFRSVISLPKYRKLTILRERWMKQERSVRTEEEKFELWVRINPVYTDLNDRMYDMLCNENAQAVDEYVDAEMNDLLRQLLEVFGSRDDFMSMQDVLNSVKCLNKVQIEERWKGVFGQDEMDELQRVIEVEYNDNQWKEQNALFIELALSQSCLEDDDVDGDDDEHYLWIGRNIVVFAALPVVNERQNHNNRHRM